MVFFPIRRQHKTSHSRAFMLMILAILESWLSLTFFSLPLLVTCEGCICTLHPPPVLSLSYSVKTLREISPLKKKKHFNAVRTLSMTSTHLIILKVQPTLLFTVGTMLYSFGLWILLAKWGSWWSVALLAWWAVAQEGKKNVRRLLCSKDSLVKCGCPPQRFSGQIQQSGLAFLFRYILTG